MMNLIDDYRDPQRLQARLQVARRLCTRRWTIMDVCGGQTHSLLRFGIEAALSDCIEFIHGPGCPVCVTPSEVIDTAIELSLRPGVLLTTFGDMLRVPGSAGSLLQARAAGGQVRMVYSPCDAVQLAARQPEVTVVVTGFEPLDLVEGLIGCLEQLESGRAEVENRYTRCVRPDGNPDAMRLIERVFAISDLPWRGLGVLRDGGFNFRADYVHFDACHRFGLDFLSTPSTDNVASCSAVLTGAIRPPACPLFGTVCTPDAPQGAPMVSSEGACAAYYRYARSGATADV